jgi:hypothetical protein
VDELSKRTTLEMDAGRAAIRQAKINMEWKAIPGELELYNKRLQKLVPNAPLTLFTKYAFTRWPEERDTALEVIVHMGRAGNDVTFSEPWPDFPSETLIAQILLVG